MLGKEKSLKNSRAISYILKKGKTKESKYFRLKFVESRYGDFKAMSIIPSKSYKKAVLRNLARRRIRHLVQMSTLNQNKILGIFFTKTDVTKTSFLSLKEDFLANFNKI